MNDQELDELARLRASLIDIEKRVQDAITATYRCMEGVRDARIALSLLASKPMTPDNHQLEMKIVTKHDIVS